MAQEAVFARQNLERGGGPGWTARDGLHAPKYRGVNPPGRKNRTSHSQQAGLAWQLHDRRTEKKGRWKEEGRRARQRWRAKTSRAANHRHPPAPGAPKGHFARISRGRGLRPVVMRHACHDMQRRALAQWALQDKLETCTCMHACSRARRI